MFTCCPCHVQDVLTDLSISLEEIEVNVNPFSTMKTQVHLGMHKSARNILEELLDKERHQRDKTKGSILEECFRQYPVSRLSYNVSVKVLCGQPHY